MSQPNVTLDPDPGNILGKGILDPEREAKLLAEGYIFAMWIQPKPSRKGDNPPPFLVRCKRPIAEAITDALLDAYYTRRGASFLANERETCAPTEFVPS
jgi:hypothetical protein